MKSNIKKGSVIKGYKVLEVRELNEFNGTGIFFKHIRTGLEVFHIYNDDSENLFAFAFKTPSSSSNGAAHVLEHTVLTGSLKFPLKDPFVKMLNQSVKTYLNAYTASDRTVFPASSLVPKDYYNLMSVYGDAVFFPLLRKECFLQEAHHLEVDKKGNAKIQGVVFNEMKGAYSSFDDKVNDDICHALLQGTIYDFDSGGDPLEIPNLTHAQLKAFHKKYYCTNNCLLFLYGNIDTLEQLDFVNENFLSRIYEYGNAAKFKSLPKKTVIPFYKSTGPSCDAGEKKATVIQAWKTGLRDKNGVPSFERIFENLFLTDLLMGSDSAPLVKALLDSKLGQDIAPQSGGRFEIQENYLSLGLRGVKEGEEKKVIELIEKTISTLVKNGINEDDIARTIHDLDFENKEVKRGSVPYGMVLLRRVLRSWTYGGSPFTSLCVNEASESLKKKIKENPSYPRELLKNLLLENKEKSFILVKPNASYSKNRDAEEEKLALNILKAKGKEKVLKELNAMYKFQQKPLSSQEEKMLPHLKINDLTVKAEKLNLQKKEINGINVFESKEHTNGISYVRVMFPMDTLEAEDYLFAPVLTNTVTDCGWKNLSWDQAANVASLNMGSFFATCSTDETRPDDKKNLTQIYQGRDYLTFAFKILNEETDKAFDIVSDCISGTDFHDTKRIKDLILSQKNYGVSSVIPNGCAFAQLRSARFDGRSNAINELWDGVRALFMDDELTKMPVKKVCERLRKIFIKIKNSGAIIHITADREGLKIIEKKLPDFIKKTELKSLKKAKKIPDSDFFALTALKGEDWKKSFNDKKTEVFTIPGNSGFAGASFAGEKTQKKQWADIVLSRFLSKSILWEEIRTSGGAYGVNLSTSDRQCDVIYYTYRDPKPFESLEVLTNIFFNVQSVKIGQSELEKTLTGCYSNLITPQLLSEKGAMALRREIYHYNKAFISNKVKYLKSMKCKDLEQALESMSKRVKDLRSVVICGKSLILPEIKKNYGKIISLPL